MAPPVASARVVRVAVSLNAQDFSSDPVTASFFGLLPHPPPSPPAAVTGVSPSSGPVTGRFTVAVEGEGFFSTRNLLCGFFSANRVLLNTSRALFVNDRAVTCVVPAVSASLGANDSACAPDVCVFLELSFVQGDYTQDNKMVVFFG